MKTILIIEDDVDTLNILEIIAGDLNLNVVSSPVAIALADVKELKPDLILLDHRMGGKSGGDLSLEIKANRATKHIPVVILSADSNIFRIASEGWADGFLAKPFNINDLILIIEKYISH